MWTSLRAQSTAPSSLRRRSAASQQHDSVKTCSRQGVSADAVIPGGFTPVWTGTHRRRQALLYSRANKYQAINWRIGDFGSTRQRKNTMQLSELWAKRHTCSRSAGTYGRFGRRPLALRLPVLRLPVLRHLVERTLQSETPSRPSLEPTVRASAFRRPEIGKTLRCFREEAQFPRQVLYSPPGAPRMRGVKLRCSPGRGWVSSRGRRQGAPPSSLLATPPPQGSEARTTCERRTKRVSRRLLHPGVSTTD